MPQNPLAATVAVKNGAQHPLELDTNSNLMTAEVLAGNRTSGAVTVTTGSVTLFAAGASPLERHVRNLDGNVTLYLNGNSTLGFAVPPSTEYVERNSTSALTGTSGSGNISASIMGLGY